MTITTLEDTLKAANLADHNYSEVIKRHFGSKATRWTITNMQAAHPEVKAAYEAKVSADLSMHLMFEEGRGK